MIAQTSNYWISSSLINAYLNVDGNYNQVLISVDSKASLYVYINGYVNTIPVLNAYTNKVEATFQTFKLKSLSYDIPDNDARYVHAVIPRKTYTATSYSSVPESPTGYITLLKQKSDIIMSGDSDNYYIYLGAIISVSETNATLHERTWQETMDFGSLSPVKDAGIDQYWIKQGAINISLNSLGETDKINASAASNSVIIAYIPGYDGLDYDAGHNYRRWYLEAYPTAFGTNEKKYVYVAIPHDPAMNNQTAYVVFPSEHIGIDGKNLAGEQIGSESYYYIFLRAIISASGTNGETARKWLNSDEQEMETCPIEWGTLSTDDQNTNGAESEWWTYNRISGIVTFLKTIASAIFNKLFAKKAEITDLTVTNEVATTQQVVDHTDWGTYTADAAGATVRRNADGNWLIETDYLKVRKKATFTNVEIQDVYHVGGQMMLTAASCRVDMLDVIKTTKNNQLVTSSYRVYFKKHDSSGQTVENTWLVNDQAYCNTFDYANNNREAGNFTGSKSNHFLWCLVTAVGQYPVAITEWSDTTKGKMVPIANTAASVANGSATIQAFIEKWDEVLKDTKSLRDDASTYNVPLTDVNSAMAVVSNNINLVLKDSSNASLLADNNFLQNGLWKYASAIDKVHLDLLKAMYHTITLSYESALSTGAAGCAAGSDAPRIGDNLVQLGYRNQGTDDNIRTRQGALILAGAGASSPYIYMFKNIGRKWGETKAKKELGTDVWNSYTSEKKAAVINGCYFVLPTPYIQLSPQKTVINADEIHYGTDTDDEGFDDTGTNLSSVFNTYDKAISDLKDDMKEINVQMDGSFRIWQGDNDASGKPIYPTSFKPSGTNVCVLVIDATGEVVDGWSTESLDERVGDFYIATDGKVWQFKSDVVYHWQSVTDEYLITFVNQIKEKKRVFLLTNSDGEYITSATDVADYFANRDYEVGDLWVAAFYYTTDASGNVTKVYDYDTLVCVKDKSTGFQITDWNKDNNYHELINNQMAIISEITSDNVITTGAEKQSLENIFNDAVATRELFYNTTTSPEQKRYTSISYTEFDTAWTNLLNLMKKVFGITEWKGSVSASTKNTSVYNGTIILCTSAKLPADAINTTVTGVKYSATTGRYYITVVNDDSVFNFLFKQYYDESSTMQDAVSSHILSVGQSAVDGLNRIADENIITLEEHSQVLVADKEITREHTNLTAYGKAYGSNYATYATDAAKKTKYNTFAAAFNAYQQAYLDYHALADIILHADKNLVFYEGREAYGISTDDDNALFLIDAPLTGVTPAFNYVVGSTYLANVNTANEETGLYALNSIVQGEDNYTTNCNVSFTSENIATGTTYHILHLDTYLSVVSAYTGAALALQNQMTAISQELAEENSRQAMLSILGAAVTDNILTSNEKRTICQQLNNIGSDYQYAVKLAKEILDDDDETDGMTEPDSDTYPYQHKVWQAYNKLTAFFHLLAGAKVDGNAYYQNAEMYNGIAHVIGISRQLSYISDSPFYKLGFTFTVDKDTTTNVVSEYDLNDFFYRIKLSANTDDGMTEYDEIDYEGGEAMTEFVYYNSSHYTWYQGRGILQAFTDYCNASDAFSLAVNMYNKAVSDGIASQLGTISGDIEQIKNDISKVTDDNLITPAEKQESIIPRWEAIMAQYAAITFSNPKTTAENNIVTAYNTLETMMQALSIKTTLTGTSSDLDKTFYLLGYDGTTTGMKALAYTRAQFITNFTNWSTALQAYQDGKNGDIADANTKATDAATAVDGIASDGIISAGSEKQNLYQIYYQILTTVNNYKNQCSSYGITISQSGSTVSASYASTANDNVKTLGSSLVTYITAFNVLKTYLVTTLTVFDNFNTDTKLSDKSSSASAFRTQFTTYYTAESTFADALEDFKTKQLASASIDMVGGSITIKADTNITIDSSKIIIGKDTSDNDVNLNGCLAIENGAAQFNGNFKVGNDNAYVEIKKQSDGAKMVFYTKNVEDSLPNEAGYISVRSSGPDLCFHSTQYGDITMNGGVLTVGKNTSNEIIIEGGDGDFIVKRGNDYYDLKEDTATDTLVFKKRT